MNHSSLCRTEPVLLGIASVLPVLCFAVAAADVSATTLVVAAVFAASMLSLPLTATAMFAAAAVVINSNAKCNSNVCDGAVITVNCIVYFQQQRC